MHICAIDRGEGIVFAQVVAAEPDKIFKFPGGGFNPTCWRAVSIRRNQNNTTARQNTCDSSSVSVLQVQLPQN